MKTRTGFALLLSVAAAATAGFAAASASNGRTPMTAREKAVHVLNRLGFGPRPGEVEKVLKTGVAAYIEAQLAPERIADPLVTAKLKALPTLEMSTSELFDNFERPLREARRQRKEAAVKENPAMKQSQADAADEAQKVRDMIPPSKRPRRIVEELSAARIVRAAESERQFNEVLVDFWMNHFNVYAAKGLDRIFITSFERDVIRPLIWGKFEDLLLATAESPAMLFYLDNARSVADEAHRPKGPVEGEGLFARREGSFGRRPILPFDPDMLARVRANAPKGINENYARELMELHTLGVDGGYTQKDVTELARILTGWSIDRGADATGFVFRARMHDVGAKTVLGYKFAPGGGIEEGERIIRILAHHPATAHHLAFQLCQLLVADEPPAALVDRVAKKFLASGGDLRETVRAIVTSPEFFDPQYYRAKVKSPFEYVVSAVRATGGTTDGRIGIAGAIAQMGEPLYLCQPPTGYSDVSSAWVNTGALVARLNFALNLAANKLPGTETVLERLVRPEEAADPGKVVDALAKALVGGGLSPETGQTIEKRLTGRLAPADGPSANAQIPLIAGLILGSPDFQKR